MLFILTVLVRYHEIRNASCWKPRYIFIFRKGKNTTISLGKKEQKPRKRKPKKGVISLTICMQRVFDISLSSPLIFVFDTLSDHSKGKPSYECRWGQGKKRWV